MSIYLKILPVILIFILGYFLKKTKLFDRADADLFLKVVFYVASPALILLSVSSIKLSASLWSLPISAVIIILVSYLIAAAISHTLKLPRESLGTFLIACLIMNVGFLLPFVLAAFGNEGVAKISLFDFANGLLTFTFVYYLAVKYGQGQTDKKFIRKKILISPPIWALIIAITLNLSKVQITGLAHDFLQPLSYLVSPMIMLSLGIYFQPKLSKFKIPLLVLILRSGLGLLLGLLLASLFHLSGLDRIILILAAAAPVGYNTLTFSSLEKLDQDMAANIISLSLLFSIIFIPILIGLLQ
ncbi:MAG: AEC family transporter [Patescibacteria group bacterium]